MRISKNELFMNVARQIAKAGTCGHLLVGAVIVDPETKTILSTGYNGAPRGMPHCEEKNHDLVHDHCTMAVHAELNAIINAARTGVKIDGATIYTTHSPCKSCFNSLINAGIKHVVFCDRYPFEELHDTAAAAKISLTEMRNGISEGNDAKKTND